MTNYSHLCKEQRENIQYLIDSNFTFTKIGKAIDKDRTTVAKEIKRNRYLKSYTSNDVFNPKLINEAINACERLSKPPYVCNNCKSKGSCRKNKLYYHSNIAENRYQSILTTSRQGIDITEEAIDEIERSIVPLIKKKKQSVNQVYINHSDILYFSKPTFYKYVNLGVLSLTDLDLPKKVKYKPRNNKMERDYKRKNALLKGRSYEDYLKFIDNHPRMNLNQMDTVIGTVDSNKVLLTIINVKTHFMFIRLLDKKDIKSVNNAWDSIKKNLDYKLFASFFRIVLTDNGTEFYDPMHIERNYENGKKIINVFYCKPYSSWQKGCIEKNHEFIRKIFSKGTSFDDFTDRQIQKLEDTINNIPRDSLNGKTPYNLMKEKYPDIIDKLNCSYISPDEVSLNKKDILGDK